LFDASPHHFDGVTDKGSILYAKGVNGKGKAAIFDGKSRFTVPGLKNFAWGTHFSVSLWFKRTGGWGKFAGLVNNGYGDKGSFQIHMGGMCSHTRARTAVMASTRTSTATPL